MGGALPYASSNGSESGLRSRGLLYMFSLSGHRSTCAHQLPIDVTSNAKAYYRKRKFQNRRLRIFAISTPYTL
ncbi:hypothetical protein CANTEDRAFT_113106 [Yamadazyma tenuis ATCC 10573]|uniref:Uncharacterized protein n=1 Tax=Candida tenuis (strain ATCC 10573 / BCRC 21748 / CBS 615 / JCM 9827 / NBRC 10315 / NRRL Y-1498 / VKM Y-70) TaxID=590646 RepID=G3B0E8_CANTC|nr:uncharacterized protein CANTEDRAFT_113106 [Yamadazyma tenuis ATCC 10573]EGV65384.1 hypothetical protein CANTEDRAFT_113106 [Yamadazyma tenuis ATCC 10573]